MEILMASAELSPFTAESETGHTVAGLSRTLVQLGHAVTVALPRYPSFEERGLLVARRLTPLKMPWGDTVTVFDGQLGSGVKLVLLDSPGLYARPGVFGEEGKDYPDNARRFAFYAHAVAALAQQRAAQGQGFDVLHAHDFPGGLAALALGLVDVPLPKVVSIHEPERVGTFPLKAFESLGFDSEAATMAAARVGSRWHVLKGALAVADVVTTDASSVARELAQPPTAEGAAGSELVGAPTSPIGILPGLDYALDNPATDSALARRFNAENWEPKGMCKSALLRRLGLELEPPTPLVLALGPLSKAAGMDVLAGVLPEVLKQDLNLIVAGTADSPAKSLLKTFGARSYRERENYRFLENADESEGRRLLAGADILLCPAPNDRVVLLPRRGQRYGAVPVVHRGGAASDAFVDCDPALSTGTAFLYESSPEDLLGALGRALSGYRRPQWSALVRRVMRLDSGWESPARRYVRAYEKACA